MLKNKIIHYGHQYIDEKDIEFVSHQLRSDFLTQGSTVNEFEKALCELTGARFAIVCSNGTAALHLACLSLGITSNDVGVTSPITFLASANCIEYCHGSADFVDIDPNSLCISVDALEEFCKKKRIPKLVIPVDFTGIPCNLGDIRKLAERYGFYVIEDAAHAIGSTYTIDNSSYSCGSCSHSDLSIFSFHPVKTITCGEGGAILTNRPDMAELLRQFRNHGIRKKDRYNHLFDSPWYYEMEEIGFNYRLTDIQCALGISQLKKINLFKTRRMEIVKRYNEAFTCEKKLITFQWPENTNPCFHLYVIQIKDGSMVRNNLYSKLNERNIQTQVHYIPVYLQPYYKNKYGYSKGKCPHAEQYYSQCLSLPLYPSLSNEEVDFVIHSILEILHQGKN